MILINSKKINKVKLNESVFDVGLCIYEVVRVFNSRVIFLQDNLARLDNSLKKSGKAIEVEGLNLVDKLQKYIDLQGIREGNIKYVMHFKDKSFDLTVFDEYLFQIEHSYPSTDDYKNGVAAISYRAVRSNPEVKYVNSSLRTITNELRKECNVYEVILVDNDDCITEGSRSNIFFAKENIVYTAPTEYVLPGTSRKRVIDICKNENIEVVERKILLSEIENYDFVFITGTSPLLLPINKIDSCIFSTQVPLLKRLISCYFKLL